MILPASSTPLLGTHRPGEGYAVLGEQVALLLPAGDRERAAALWLLVDAGAAGAEVLDALLAGGLGGLPAFVLAWCERGASGGQEVRVVVRGEASARLDGALVDGRTARTWVEGRGTRLEGLWLAPPAGALEAADAVDTDGAVPSPGGVFRASALHAGPAAPPAPRPAAPVAEQRPAAEAALTEALAATSPPLPADADHDGLTRAGDPRPHPVARLVLSTGELVEVDRAVLVGRAPQARRSPAGERPRLVAVPSPQHEISSTHLEVRPGDGADQGLAVVTDLGSTNGTVLAVPGLPAEELRPGVTVQLVPGAVLDLGDDLTIEVVRP